MRKETRDLLGNAWAGPDAMAISDLHLFRPRLWPTAIVSRGRCDRRIAGKSQAHLDIRLRELGRASSGCYDSGRLDCEGDVQTWMLRLASAKHSVICVQERPAMNVILAEETSFGLRMMADATDAHTLWVLIRVRQWHVESEAYDRALARVVEAQAGLPIHGHSGFERRPIICRHSARRRPGKREIRQDARPSGLQPGLGSIRVDPSVVLVDQTLEPFQRRDGGPDVLHYSGIRAGSAASATCVDNEMP